MTGFFEWAKLCDGFADVGLMDCRSSNEEVEEEEEEEEEGGEGGRRDGEEREG